jgi:serine/threonine protein kinase
MSSLSRPRLSVDESPRPGSTEPITFRYQVTDYEFRTDERGRKKTIGEGAWSDVYLATPCPPKPTEQSALQSPCAPEMTPPLTPVRTIDSAIGLDMLPGTPSLYAVKVPAMTSAKKVLAAEARILSYLSRFPDAENHIVSFYGLDTRTGALILKAMDDTLEGWIQKELNTLDEASRARKLSAVFPSIALALIASLQWMQDKDCTHADIKPSNILVSSPSFNSAPRPVYTDFSSTMLSRPDAPIESEVSPLGAGTWDYLDPSLLSSSSTTSPSSVTDLWSLAITLLFLVLGSSSYDAFKANKFQQREMIKSGSPLQCMGYDDQGVKNIKRVRALSKNLGFDVQKWFAKVLVKDAGKRVGIEEWRQELEMATTSVVAKI